MNVSVFFSTEQSIKKIKLTDADVITSSEDVEVEDQDDGYEVSEDRLNKYTAMYAYVEAENESTNIKISPTSKNVERYLSLNNI